MLLSMTGVAKVAIPHMGATLIIEIQSLNRKGLEIHISLPEEFHGFDFAIRKKVQEKLQRGTIQLKVYYKTSEDKAKSIQAMLDEYGELSKISFELDLGKPTLSDFLLYMESRKGMQLQKEVPLETHDVVMKGVDQVLAELVACRAREGKELLEDLKIRIEHLHALVTRVEKLKGKSREELIRKLQEKYDELYPSLKDNNLLYRELVLFVEKTDIAEEIVRFRGHLTALSALFESKEKNSGKTLEFYIHELQREASTMAAKCLDPEISHCTIEIRSELERIREQLQNVE